MHDPHPLKEAKWSHIKPLACLTDAQIKAHLASYIEANKLPKGMSTVYYVLTPPAWRCASTAEAPPDTARPMKKRKKATKHSFCSYHGDINPGGLESGSPETILYGVIPWTAGGWGDGQLAAEDETRGSPNARTGDSTPPKKRNRRKQRAEKQSKRKKQKRESSKKPKS